MKSGVVFGAGSIGRGFVGPLLSAAGWRVTFVDVSTHLVDRLNADGAYNQIIVDDGGERTVRVGPIEAVLIADEDAVVRSLIEADLVATAVGAGNLQSVATLLAAGTTAREHAGAPDMDVLLCENLHHAPAVFRGMMAEHIAPEVASRVGLAATSIGRMVPQPLFNDADPTAVRVEPYSFLPYDARAFRGPHPVVEGLVAVKEGFALYEDRKLYVHNLGHCALAYLGELRGYDFVWQAVEDVELRSIARGVMVETAMAITEIHGVACGPLLQHVDDLLARFGNRRLADTTERVGRDPVRKMQPDDRFLGSYSLCRRTRVTPSYVSLAVALGASKLSSVVGWDRQRVIEYLDRHLFTHHPDAQLRRQLDQQMHSIENGLDVRELTRLMAQSYIPSRIVAGPP